MLSEGVGTVAVRIRGLEPGSFFSRCLFTYECSNSENVDIFLRKLIPKQIQNWICLFSYQLLSVSVPENYKLELSKPRGCFGTQRENSESQLGSAMN